MPRGAYCITEGQRPWSGATAGGRPPRGASDPKDAGLWGPEAVDVYADVDRYRQGSPLQITHHGQTINVTTDGPVTRPIAEIAAGKPPRQPMGSRPTPRRTPRLRLAGPIAD
jgi:hypothetical protein